MGWAWSQSEGGVRYSLWHFKVILPDASCRLEQALMLGLMCGLREMQPPLQAPTVLLGVWAVEGAAWGVFWPWLFQDGVACWVPWPLKKPIWGWEGGSVPGPPFPLWRLWHIPSKRDWKPMRSGPDPSVVQLSGLHSQGVANLLEFLVLPSGKPGLHF